MRLLGTRTSTALAVAPTATISWWSRIRPCSNAIDRYRNAWAGVWLVSALGGGLRGAQELGPDDLQTPLGSRAVAAASLTCSPPPLPGTASAATR